MHHTAKRLTTPLIIQGNQPTSQIIQAPFSIIVGLSALLAKANDHVTERQQPKGHHHLRSLTSMHSLRVFHKPITLETECHKFWKKWCMWVNQLKRRKRRSHTGNLFYHLTSCLIILSRILDPIKKLHPGVMHTARW